MNSLLTSYFHQKVKMKVIVIGNEFSECSDCKSKAIARHTIRSLKMYQFLLHSKSMYFILYINIQDKNERTY